MLIYSYEVINGKRISAALLSAAVALFICEAKPVEGQQPPAYRAPRLPGTQNPDLNGVWQAMNSANWNIEPHAAAPSPFPPLLGAIGAEPAGQGVVEGGKIPYLPAAEARLVRRGVRIACAAKCPRTNALTPPTAPWTLIHRPAPHRIRLHRRPLFL